MPNNKRSGRGNRRSGDRNDFFEHDRRNDGISNMSKSRPGFRDRSSNKTSLGYASVARFLDDEDIDMIQRRLPGPGHSMKTDRGGQGGGRNTKGRGRRHQAAPPQMRVVFRLPISPTSWYKVVIPHGAKYEKQWILDTLLTAVAPTTFTPVAYATQGLNSFFYIDNYEGARKLFGLDNRLSTNDGYKLKLTVRTQNNNSIEITEGMKDAVKNALANRFNVATVSLDLSKFHHDPEIMDKYYVPLNSTAVLKAVLSMVAENCPNILGINLSQNMLFSIEGLRSSVTKMPQLRVLHLDHNMIASINGLDILKACELDELTLNSNPFCAKYPEQETYSREVRLRLPKLKILDGVVLPPPILFDDENNKVPPSRGSYLCAEEGKTIVCQFLEQYYAIFDSDSRLPLADAYHEDAMLSITNQQLKDDKGRPFYQNSRNLLRVGDAEKRNRYLTRGRSNIIGVLNSLPKTQHDPQSFIVDLTVFTPQLLVLNVMGVFRGENPKMPNKSFFRSLVIVPQNAGFCITNETIFITTATPRQIRSSFRTSLAPVAPVPTVPSPLVAPVAVAPVAVASLPVMGLQDELEAKRKMVETLALQTSMNLQWSEKCLVETAWDFQKACLIFTELHKEGRVPAEAFLK